jgi:hypothetical protein
MEQPSKRNACDADVVPFCHWTETNNSTAILFGHNAGRHLKTRRLLKARGLIEGVSDMTIATSYSLNASVTLSKINDNDSEPNLLRLGADIAEAMRQVLKENGYDGKCGITYNFHYMEVEDETRKH